jgi:hypothetical protein
MSLERINVTFKMDREMHALLRAEAHVRGCEIGETVEAIVTAVLEKRLHECRVLVAAVDRPPASGAARLSAATAVGGRR